MHPALHTRATALFGVDVPIVQTGMGWVAGASLVAATAEAGALGILAAATMTVPELEAAIRKVKTRTRRPFGVNLRADHPDADAMVALLIREGVRVASFARAPGPDAIARLKDAGLVCMPTIGAPRHAEKVVKWGVDAVIAQGAEGGGHTGAIPTSVLVPQVVDAVDVPVIAAGGFRDGRGLVAALAWGASGVAMGTRFLLTRESHVPDTVKQAYLGTPLDGTVVTTAIDGYPQRVVRTPFVDALERAGWVGRLVAAVRHALAFRSMTGSSLADLVREGLAMRRSAGLTLPQVAMAANAPMYTRAALVDGRVDAGVLPTGQVAGAIDELPSVAELVDRIVAEAEATLDRLGAPVATPARRAEAT
ncbi:MAG: nitronate monooxygenase [Alphaproteobacteria bacterium]|nr:nitronate monooxygenase [Alphaproteobacteria bacterium]